MADDTKEVPARSIAPEHHLVVVHPFGDHGRGSMITDPDEIAAVLAGESHHSVRRVFPR